MGSVLFYSVGQSNKPATVSFLAPAQDKNRAITPNRKRAMELIVAINNELQSIIPGQIGLYDDAFNVNCVGDKFQTRNVPTLLFEAGHCNNDYNRETVREYIYIALISLINHISVTDTITGCNYYSYLDIPQNGKQFYDIIIRNAILDHKKKSKPTDIAIQFEEVLLNNRVDFVPKIAKIDHLNTFYGHREIDAKNNIVTLKNTTRIKVNVKLTSININSKEFSLKPIIN